MGQFLVVAVGPHSSHPTETSFGTATEALAQVAVYRRLCGRSGTVEVLGPGGRRVADDTLMRMAAEEVSGRAPRKRFEPVQDKAAEG